MHSHSKNIEAYESICRMYGRSPEIELKYVYMWVNQDDKTGVILAKDGDCDLTIFTVDNELEIFDVWTEGHFVDYGKIFYDPYKIWLDEKIDKELIATTTWELPMHLYREVFNKLIGHKSESMFGDGAEIDIIMNGANIVGLNEMTHHQLVEEYEQYVDEDDRLLMEIKGHIAVEELLHE